MSMIGINGQTSIGARIERLSLIPGIGLGIRHNTVK